jgi:hypothetical protein
MATRSTPTPDDTPTAGETLDELNTRAAAEAAAATTAEARGGGRRPTGSGLTGVTTADTSSS